MFCNRGLRRLFNPLLGVARGEGYVGGYGHQASGQSGDGRGIIGSLDVRERQRGNFLPWTRAHARTVLAAPLTAGLATLSSEDDDESGEDECRGSAPKGKHLWFLADSYGYTKGTIYYEK